MRLDLPTLLLVRLCLDGFLVAFYLSFARRHEAIGGPGWWAVAAVCSALSNVGVALAFWWSPGLSVWSVAGSYTALFVSQACVWLGLRSYLGLSTRKAWLMLVGAALVLFGVQAFLFLVWDLPAARRLVFVGTEVALAGLSLWNLPRRGLAHKAPEFRALRWLFWFELGVLVWVMGRLVWSLSQPTVVTLNDSAPYVVLFLTMDALVRTALLSALVSFRLQQEHERARQKLIDGKAYLRALIDNIHAGVIVFSPEQTIETINAAARRFLDWSSTDSEEEHPDWAWLREDGTPMARHEMPFERVLGTGVPLTDVLLGVRTEVTPTPRWALCNAFAETDALGGLRHVVLTFMDITSLHRAQNEQKVLQVQLAQSQKMEALGTLAGGVAHDFNNILTAILGNAELARQDVKPDALARESLHEISTAARRGRELVRQILAFSRQQPMARHRVSMRSILAESCGLLKAAMPPHIILEAECGPGELSVLADTTQLGQVLLNLGTNGLHAMAGQSGRLSIRVDRFPVGAKSLPQDLPTAWLGVVRVMVKDTGCGMDETTRQRIFEPFFTTRKLGTGTGLGLPMVMGIVQAHDGVIDVQSAPGEGSTFCLYFPAAVADPGHTYIDSAWPRGAMVLSLDEMPLSEPSIPKPPSSVQNAVMTSEPQPTSRHILYLDDDDTLVFLVRRLLERRGYKVTALVDQQEAIEAVRSNPGMFDLLMTDFNMPGMSGLDVARAVLKINPSLPVAVASGYITDELQAEAIAAGVREVVFKTDAVEDFCAVVARLVEKRPA